MGEDTPKPVQVSLLKGTTGVIDNITITLRNENDNPEIHAYKFSVYFYTISFCTYIQLDG